MNNIIDYIDWRGDLSFKISPLNEIDAVILSQLAYIDFSDIVSADFSEKISLRQTCVFLATASDYEKRINFGPLINSEITTLLQKAGESKRFSNIQLCGFVSSTDIEQEKQFAAINFILPDKTNFIIYRGTDQSIVGWKEDFNMAFKLPIPAQIEAVKYFDDACKNLRGKFYLGGHSKGGNLALFSGTYCNIKNQKRILQIYNFDGPGFEEIVLKDERFLSIQKKIKNFVPKKSVVGILFDTGIEKTIVESSNNGIMQHDPLTWNLLGTNFVTTEELSKESLFIDKTLKTWLKQTDKDKRETFIEALFNVIESAEANNITEITENWFKSSAKIIHHLRNLDSDTKDIIFETIKIFFKSAQESVHEKIRK